MDIQRLKPLIGLLALGFLAFAYWKNTPKRQAPPIASAQTGCVLDRCETTPPPPAPKTPTRPPAVATGAPPQPVQAEGITPAGFRGGTAPGSFDFFVLTLSWSSGFCQTNPASDGKAQCDAGSNLGFVVHGLWPQYERGFPSDCGAGQSVSQSAIAITKGVFPDAGLARYEWGKHGTCSGWPPETYFTAAKAARDSIAIPPAFDNPREEQSFSPNDIVRAFTSANPRLGPGMLAVACKNNVLQEIRFCMSKDLRNFRPCPEVVQQSCRSREIRVPPVR